jgi:cyclophilin family peptidyl-prolyl cis-trans isomerase
MTDRTGRDASTRERRFSPRRTRTLLRIEPLEGRELMAAALAAIPNITSPAGLGYQVPLDGTAGGAASQTYTVTSSNPKVAATIAQGKFVTMNVTHVSSGANDPSFSGTMEFQLFNDLTPISASSIEQLVSSGFYNGKNFHRISAGFPDANGYIAQGGSVSGTGLDAPPAKGQPGGLPATGFPFVDEYNLQLVYNGTGQLALANAGDNTNTSQFYITTSTPRFLDFNKTIFGQLVSGQDVLNEITHVATQAGSTTPASPVIITKATLSDTNPDGVVHVDTTKANQGDSSVITVTATDPATNTTTQKSFTVNVGPTNATAPSDPNSNQRPFIQTYPTSLTVGQGQKTVFQIGAVTAQPKTDILSYIVASGVNVAKTGFDPVQNATASVDAKGIVTVTPNPGYSGPINLLIGVRNQVDHSGNGVTSPGNYDTHTVTLNVNASTTAVGLQPIALPVNQSVTANAPALVTLAGQSANPGSGQTLNYAIVSQPAHGTISNFNAAAGTFTYTAAPNYVGTDTFNYNVTSVGGPSPNLTSNISTVTLSVALGKTNAVRLIGRVLVITPPPRFDGKGNTISVAQVNGVIQATINGVTDQIQPATTALDGIIVYGTPLSDSIVIAPTVTVPTALDGGHGGTNFLTGGSEISQVNAWFGRNTVQPGTAATAVVGRFGHVKVVKGAGATSVFLSRINPAKHPHYGKPSHGNKAVPAGAFYKFVGNHLVRTKQPVTRRLIQG